MTLTTDDLKNRYIALHRSYDNLFKSPDGELVLEDLCKKFDGTTIRTVDKVVDVHASIAASGAREVLLYIDYMRKRDATANRSA